MREKYLWLAIALLTAITLGQACYIYGSRVNATEFPENPPAQPAIHERLYAEKASDAQWEEFRKWRDRIQGRLDSGGALAEPDFDVFFNDRFFSDKVNPFLEMENIHRQMSSVFQGTEKSAFDAYWEKWFTQRMMTDQFKTETGRTAEKVTLTMQIPGLAGGTPDVNITKNRIRIAFSARTASEDGSAGGIIKKETAQNFIKILPVPEDAVPGTGRVETEGQRLKITFERKQGKN